MKVPLLWATKASAAMCSPKSMLLLYLLYRAWQTKSNTIKVTNDAMAGLDRRAKRRALRQLERGGLITVKRELRKAPIVTLILRKFL